MDLTLPLNFSSIPKAPAIKQQGIKTKLVKFILGSASWHGKGRWVEPFLGTGVVLFNAAPPRALAADTNEHVIGLYKGIQSGSVTPEVVRDRLEREGALLSELGEAHFYAVRKRFNENKDPLDLLFVNRACFNGVMRFNSKGAFNVPFCKKPDRFRPHLVSKICNQVQWMQKVLIGRKWEFKVQDWRETLCSVTSDDFVYLDPPYVGRHTDYFNQWDDEEAVELAEAVKRLPCAFAYSMWLSNTYRENSHMKHFEGYDVAEFSHFYHVGSSEDLRNEMLEGLVLSHGTASPTAKPTTEAPHQASLVL
jgi:DNA adenine methylase